MSVHKIWKTKDNNITSEVLDCCQGNRVLAALLANRGIDTKEKIFKFLNPLKVKFISPDVFVDMQKSVSRIASAIENKEHITVYGDFDADGVTSTALIYLTLKKIGADVDYYLPDRSMESHGLNTKALVKIISKQKSKLIITVDCGISNVSEVNFAKGFKTDVIITDHHEAPEILPEAYAVLNPKAPDSIDSNLPIEDIQSLNYLAGVGVAFKLACKLLEKYNCEEYVHDLLPLAAVGTVGDVVELLGENRSIVAMGLELLKNGRHTGIQKLLASVGINDASSLNSDTVAFTIVPRINAAGRLESPQSAINLLISDDNELLDSSVKLLNDLNSLRQNLCDEIFTQAKKMYEADLSANKKSIVLYNNDWHLGIIGIVASKLSETYNKPVFLMTSDSNNPNIIRCSCRSIVDLNIHTILSEHKDLFEGFGGHKMAAGFSFDSNKISFESFKKLLNETIDQYSQEVDFSSVKVYADMLLEPQDITVETVQLLDKMQPFGSANPPPLFIMNNVVLNNYRMMGQNNNHLKMFVSKNNSSQLECVKWNEPDFNLPANSVLNLLFSLKLNSFNDNTVVQLMLNDIYSDAFKTSEIKLLDHRNKKNIIMQVVDFISSTGKSTAVFLADNTLKKQLNLPDSVLDKLFTIDNIPSAKEQLMFFESPKSYEDFYKIIKNTNAKIVHLMNFNISEINADTLLTKLSGMLKYSLAHLDGVFDLNRAASALSIDIETLECALALLENVSVVEYNDSNKKEYKILKFIPVEFSKIKQDELYIVLTEKINAINEFIDYYLNSSTEDIKTNLEKELKLGV